MIFSVKTVMAVLEKKVIRDGLGQSFDQRLLH